MAYMDHRWLGEKYWFDQRRASDRAPVTIDSDSCPKIIIESFIKDISGHIVLNASCQLQPIEENAKCNYNYKFPIKTEMGLLYNFAKQLPKLNEQEVGIFVELLWKSISCKNTVKKLSLVYHTLNTFLQ